MKSFMGHWIWMMVMGNNSENFFAVCAPYSKKNIFAYYLLALTMNLAG